jgi:hypothetical protein
MVYRIIRLLLLLGVIWFFLIARCHGVVVVYNDENCRTAYAYCRLCGTNCEDDNDDDDAVEADTEAIEVVVTAVVIVIIPRNSICIAVTIANGCSVDCDAINLDFTKSSTYQYDITFCKHVCTITATILEVHK